MRATVRRATTRLRDRRVVVGTLLVAITLAGIIAHANVLSFLMLILLGAPGLIVLLDALLDE